MKQENKDILKTFLEYCKEYLKLTTLPKIILTNDKSKTNTLAHYNPDSNEILVYIKNRATGDWLRSLAHELIHAKQNEKNELDDNSGKTGSKHENQANSVAGVIMRNFGKKYPNIYLAPLNEIKVNNPKYDIEVDDFGKYYYKQGTNILHRIGGPAIEWKQGSTEWYQNGKRHRLDGPAYEGGGGFNNGHKRWYINGKKLSEEEFNKITNKLNEIKVNDPRYDIKVDERGTKRYYKPGTDILHRIGGPAVEYINGEKHWFQNDKFHRLDGPAIEWADGSKSWYQNNKLHRLDGPAYEGSDGDKYWYINDKKYSKQRFNEKIKELNNNKMINEVRKGISEKIKDIKNSNLQNEAAKYKKTGILIDDTIKAYESLINEAEKHGLVKEVRYLNGKKDHYCSLKEKINSKLEILESNLQPESSEDEIIENN